MKDGIGFCNIMLHLTNLHCSNNTYSKKKQVKRSGQRKREKPKSNQKHLQNQVWIEFLLIYSLRFSPYSSWKNFYWKFWIYVKFVNYLPFPSTFQSLHFNDYFGYHTKKGSEYPIKFGLTWLAYLHPTSWERMIFTQNMHAYNWLTVNP